jgi:hypothetical protein
MGMDVNGYWQVPVVPEKWLVGPPPSDVSGVTTLRDHWIELKFPGKIIDGPGDDILLIELGQMGEKALVFITDGAKAEYLLGLACALDSGWDADTNIGFDISGISLPFVPCAVRIVALDMGGGSPGFDIANVRARIYIDQSDIATNPYPPNGVKNVPADTVLSWSSGQDAKKHVVYFGNARTFVDASANPVTQFPQPQDTNSFDPGGLELGKTYYWRIDEVSDINTNSIHTGNIWSFTVTDNLVIDDFESYDYTDNRISDSWKEGGQALIYISSDPVHRCRKSMGFDYFYYDDFNCEAVRIFNKPQNWASVAGQVLELFFHGSASNETNVQMYLTISDGDNNATVLYDNMNDIQQENWHLWKINLQNLKEVNLSNIKILFIGFYARPELIQIGRNIVYFDDIILYPSRCSEQNKLRADFNGDCVVDFKDLKDLAESWLDRRHNIYPISSPNEPLVWYRFDGDTNDSSGNSYHTQSSNISTFVPGIYGQAINFDGYKDSVEIIDANKLFAKINNRITIAFWQYGLDSPHLNDTICCSNFIYGVDNPAIAINLGCWRQPGRYNWDCGYPWSFDNCLSGEHKYSSEWLGRWNHWAFIKDAEKGIMQIYLNGKLYNSRTNAHSTISEITSFTIGSGWYGGYDGLIDDFYIFDYVLSKKEIAYIATKGTGVFDQQLLSPVNLFDDDQIDFKDFAVLASYWLEERLWP